MGLQFRVGLATFKLYLQSSILIRTKSPFKNKSSLKMHHNISKGWTLFVTMSSGIFHSETKFSARLLIAYPMYPSSSGWLGQINWNLGKRKNMSNFWHIYVVVRELRNSVVIVQKPWLQRRCVLQWKTWKHFLHQLLSGSNPEVARIEVIAH